MLWVTHLHRKVMRPLPNSTDFISNLAFTGPVEEESSVDPSKFWLFATLGMCLIRVAPLTLGGSKTQQVTMSSSLTRSAGVFLFAFELASVATVETQRLKNKDARWIWGRHVTFG